MNLHQRIDERYRSLHRDIHRRTDRLFAWLMVGQWAFAIVLALAISPTAWEGRTGSIHGHVKAAVILGGLIASLPLALAVWRPGETLTRHVMACAQVSWSALFIHLTGGRIETHFHVFGSLAFLAFYRDWRVLIPATAIVAADHFVRGLVWPESVYGTASPEWWRFLEHAGWVVFEDVFLTIACVRGVRELHETAARQIELEDVNARIESQVRARTAELRASEERFRRLCSSSPVAIWQADSAGRITYVNERWESISGRPATSVIGDGWVEAVHPDDRDRVVADWARSIRDGGGFSSELRIVRPDGGIRWVRAQACRLDSDGATPGGFVGTSEDVTEEKVLEERLRQSQKMEAIGRLAGGVAHDFNNLLTAILGYSELIMQRPECGPDIRCDADEIRKASERASGLTGQMLAFSRKSAVAPKVVDLNAVITGMEAMCRRLVGEDVEFRTTLAPDLGRVRADASQLDQILMNLVVNARDAMPRGGRLQIESFNVEVPAGSPQVAAGLLPGRYVAMSVSDTGVGMDEETRRHLFEPFFTTKERGRGTGLGLATVYGGVQQNGGHIEVHSRRGEGTIFTVFLPRVDDPLPAEPPSDRAEGAARRATILLVEDEDSVRALARRVLESCGYRVIEAACADEGLQRTAGELHRIDLVLTDVIMPGMHGVALAERLRELRPDLKVLFMSGYTDNAFARSGIDQRPVELLQKPFSPSQLLRRVRQLLEGLPA